MKTQCSKCKSSYNIDDNKIPDAGAKIKCPKCQNIIALNKPKPNPPSLSSESKKEAQFVPGQNKAKKGNNFKQEQHSQNSKTPKVKAILRNGGFEHPKIASVKKFTLPYFDKILENKIKIALAAICVIFALVAIQFLFKDDIKFSETEIREWEKSGFHIDEASNWKRAGFSSSNAGTWRGESFSPKEAKEWKSGGFDAEHAAKWKSVTSNLNKTKELLASGFDRNRPEDVLCFSDKGISFDEIKQLKLKAFRCNEAFEWSNNGFTTDNIIALSNLGFQSNDLRYAKEWQKAGFSPDEIVELVESGFGKTDVNKAKELRIKGYSTTEIANLANSENTEKTETVTHEKKSNKSVIAKKNSRKNNKYSKIFNDQFQKVMIDRFNTHIKSNAIWMDYLNLYVDNPQSLYQELVKSECDPEILEFAEYNKEFVLVYLHQAIAMFLSKQDITNAGLMFVTSYIKSPTALAATNQMEMTMETQIMRGSVLFTLYERLTSPGGFKEVLQLEFNAVYEAKMNQENGGSSKG